MDELNFAAYPPTVEKIIDAAPLNQLGPGTENEQSLDALSKLSGEALGGRITDREMAQCCLSGLWLKHDFLDRSHTISQDIASPEGSYWHGIMHRREPDYSNAKYWYRRAGAHELFEPLGKRIASDPDLTAIAKRFELVVHGHFEPYNFVDACQSIAGQNDQRTAESLRNVADLEWRFLFDHCFRNAIG